MDVPDAVDMSMNQLRDLQVLNDNEVDSSES